MEEISKMFPNLSLENVVLILVIKEILSVLRAVYQSKANGEENETLKKLATDVKEIKEFIETLYQWHNVRDLDGIPVWYIRRDSEKSLNRLSDFLEKQASAGALFFREMRDLVKENLSEIKSLQKNLERIEKSIFKRKTDYDD